MNKAVVCVVGFLFVVITACNSDRIRPNREVTIPTFSFPEPTVFEPNLSAYQIFEGNAADLIPASEYHLVELSSILFTDYSHKQRLIKIPTGTQMNRLSDGTLEYPDGTVMTKTFFYQHDERDPALGKRIIETRLEIKAAGKWNIATYLWNQDQTDATLAIGGSDTEVSWINAEGHQSVNALSCSESKRVYDLVISPAHPSVR